MVSEKRITLLPGKYYWEWNEKGQVPSCDEVQRKESKGIPFVVTYHPLLKQLEGILCRKKYLLNTNAEVKQTLTHGPMVSYRNCNKLSSKN